MAACKCDQGNFQCLARQLTSPAFGRAILQVGESDYPRSPSKALSGGSRLKVMTATHVFSLLGAGEDCVKSKDPRIGIRFDFWERCVCLVQQRYS
jgi:hypothetical protein